MPWLAGMLAKAVAASRDAEAAERDLFRLSRRIRTNGRSDVDRQLKTSTESVRRGRDELTAHLDEIARKGIQVRDLRAGIVDFPGEREGRRVWLCWRAGESAVAFWHELDAGFATRQPL